MTGLERFKQAQDLPHSGFEAALAEIRSGRKQGHWIWYVFPQLSGLGAFLASQTYGITDVAEAVEYLHDPVLRSRLLTMTTTVAERVKSGQGVSLERLMGSSIDVRKLVSSRTLFGRVTRRLVDTEGLDPHESL